MEQGKSSGNIDEATFRKMTAAYERSLAKNTETTRSVYFSKAETPKLLSFIQDTNCAGLEVYFGINDEGQLTVILGGIDVRGDLMLNTLTDMGWCCPPRCGRP